MFDTGSAHGRSDPQDLQVALYDVPELRLVLHSDESLHWLPVREENERGDPADTVLGGERLIVVDVDLRDGCIGVGRDRLDDRFEHLARAAPLGVKVDQDDVVVSDGFVQTGRSLYRERLRRTLSSRFVTVRSRSTVAKLLEFLLTNLFECLVIGHSWQFEVQRLRCFV